MAFKLDNVVPWGRNYVWKNIKNINELEKTRMSAMKKFLSDYEKGKAEGCYIFHELPQKLPYGENYLIIRK